MTDDDRRMAAKKNNPYARELARLAKATAKTKPAKLHVPLYEVFVIVAASGEVAATKRVLDAMYGLAPVPKESFNVFATPAIDVYCAAANFGDLSRGRPAGSPVSEPPPLRERVTQAARMIHQRVLSNQYRDNFPEDDSWQSRADDDPHRWIERWRRIQRIAAEATPESERDALARVDGYLADLGPERRGAGYGSEVALCLDLALRHDAPDIAKKVVAAHAHRFESEAFLLQEILCYPTIASAIVKGLLREVIALSTAELAPLLDDILSTALTTSLSAAPAAKPPKLRPTPTTSTRRSRS